MRIAFVFFMFLTCCLCSCEKQITKQQDTSVKFDSILKYFNTRNYTNDTIKGSLIHRNKNYSIEISKKPIPLTLREIVVKNPIDSTYPMCYSVAYQDRLISLFEPGIFVCHSIATITRDTVFERKLNSKKFQYHWIADGKLIGLSEGKYYYLNSDYVWLEYTASFPLKKQPKLFEDSTYISFCDCWGEWGGTVYFYNKRTRKVSYTEATCANTILKMDSSYLVLSQLMHGFGSTELKSIPRPEKLSKTNLIKANNTFHGVALGYADNSNEAKTVFSYHSIQVYSSFIYHGRTFYLAYWRGATFLAEITNNTISIVNPLFNSEIFTINPITTIYDKSTVINLDFYAIAGEREVSCIIIYNNQLIKLDWNKKHNRYLGFTYKNVD